MSLTALLALAVVVVSMAAEAPHLDANKLISPGAVGPFRIGMKVDTVKTLTKQESIKLIDLNGEGLFEPAIVIAPGLLADLSFSSENQWVIERFQISDPTFYTKPGIHVGSTFSDVIHLYKSIKVSNEEGAHLIDEEESILFDMSDGPLTSSVVKAIVVLQKRT